MNILLGYHGGWSTGGYFFEEYFRCLNHDVAKLAFEKTVSWTNWNNRLPFFVPKGMPLTISALQRQLQKRFDVVLEFDGTNLHHISGLKSFGGKKALWSCDIYRADKQRFHRWIENDFDVIFVAHKNFVPFFKKRKAFWMPYATDPKVFRKHDLPKIHDLTFVGNTDPAVYPERAKLLEGLQKNFKVKVVRTGVFGEELAKLYSQSKMVFNKSHSGEINLRPTEVPACGTLFVTDRLKPETGLEEILQHGKHLVLYDNKDDLMDKVSYYLSHDQEREAIALAGHNEVLAKHTYVHRAKAMLEILAGLEQ